MCSGLSVIEAESLPERTRTMRHMVIDGHNDHVLHRWRGDEAPHIDLDTARAAGFAGGFFALYVPSASRFEEPTVAPYAVPLPDPVSHEEAARVAEELYATLCALPVAQATSADDF